MLKRIAALWVGCFLSALVFANPISPTTPTPPTPTDPSPTLESLINRYVQAFQLSPDNQFKLAAYAELKGKYQSESDALKLQFGSLGEVSLFPNNLLFRTGDHRVYHLNTGEVSEEQSARINEELRQLFERVILLGNHGTHPLHIEFVDRYLSRKNLEPFTKLFVRHILIKYGRYDHRNQEVRFHTDWLPERTFNYRSPEDDRIVKKTMRPMSVTLSEFSLRGYYLWSGGTVFIEDVNRKVAFATGEQYDPNIDAFKVFAQKLFVQTVQYISRMESERLQMLAEVGTVVTNPMRSAPSTSAPSAGKPSKTTGVQPLYHPDGWIPMMLTILRSQKILISDQEIISLFVDQEYFPKLYEQLTQEEKKEVDRFLARREE